MWPEALPPFIIIAGCIAFTGYAIKYLDRWENKGKARRYHVDEWDLAMLKRDERITGQVNKQQAL